MRGMLAVLMLLLVGAPAAMAAPFKIRFTMPRFDGGGTCAAPILLPQPAGHRNLARLFWSGPVSGADSIAGLADGDTAWFTREVPEGTYQFRASVCDSGGCSCDTTIVVFVGAPPAVPAGLRLVP